MSPGVSEISLNHPRSIPVDEPFAGAHPSANRRTDRTMVEKKIELMRSGTCTHLCERLRVSTVGRNAALGKYGATKAVQMFVKWL